MNFTKKARLWYLSGGMTKFGAKDFYKSNDWRRDIKAYIENKSDYNILCFNPNDHWSLTSDPEEFTDLEAMRLDIYKLRQSELVIYNNNDPLSRGSMIELGIAYERGLPIIVLNEDHQEEHPWLVSMAEKICYTTNYLLMYLQDHYMGMD